MHQSDVDSGGRSSLFFYDVIEKGTDIKITLKSKKKKMHIFMTEAN